MNFIVRLPMANLSVTKSPKVSDVQRLGRPGSQTGVALARLALCIRYVKSIYVI